MKLDDSFTVRQIKNADEILGVFSKYSKYLPDILENSDIVSRHSENIVKHGVCFVAFRDDKPLGFTTGYANNYETKCAYCSLLVISHEAGLLRGVIWNELFYKFAMYAKSQGMKYTTGHVHDTNVYARKQYLKMGAEVIGRDEEHSYDLTRVDLDILLQALGRRDERQIST